MYYFLLVVFIIVALLIIVSVLLQRSKGDVGSAFGGMGQGVFGPEGIDTILTKITYWLGMLLMLTALLMAILHPSKRGSLIKDENKRSAPVEQPKPAGQKDSNSSPSKP